MIHVAPCSCELHQALREALERNRELEAELAELREKDIGWDRSFDMRVADYKARVERAEDAEAKMAMFVNTPNNWLLEKDRMLVRIHELSGRVRELEAELSLLRKASGKPDGWLPWKDDRRFEKLRQDWMDAVDARDHERARAEKAEKWAVAADHEVEVQKARVAELLAQSCGHCGKPWVVRVGDETPSQGVQEREE